MTDQPTPPPKPLQFFELARNEAVAFSNGLAQTYPELAGVAVVLVWDQRLGTSLPGCIIAGAHGDAPSAGLSLDLIQQMAKISTSLLTNLQQVYNELNEASSRLAKKLNEQTQQLARNTADGGGADQSPAGQPAAVSDPAGSA
jgi:hypothetical protein